jgi:hypothetical protein
VPRRGDETQPEPLEIVDRVVERVDLELAAVAGAGIDLADRQAAAEPRARRGGEPAAELAQLRLVHRRRVDRQRLRDQGAAEDLPHQRSCPE